MATTKAGLNDASGIIQALGEYFFYLFFVFFNLTIACIGWISMKYKTGRAAASTTTGKWTAAVVATAVAAGRGLRPLCLKPQVSFFYIIITSSYTNSFLFTGTHFTHHHHCTTCFYHHLHLFSPPPPLVFTSTTLLHHHHVFLPPPPTHFHHTTHFYHHHHALSPPTTTSTCQHASGRVPQPQKWQWWVMNDEWGLRCVCVLSPRCFFLFFFFHCTNLYLNTQRPR